MKSDNHYEAAFDAFLRQRGCAVVPVVESRRSYLDAAAVKSPDFLVLAPGGAKLVIDVKGRKFPGRVNGKPRAVWRNWCERQDADSLAKWTATLGGGFQGVLAFVYDLASDIALPCETPDLFRFRERAYLIRGVPVCDYRRHMRTCSPRWGTVDLPADAFRRLVKPITHFLDARDEEVLTGSQDRTG